MASRGATQSAANSDVETEQPNNTAASDTRKRKAPASRNSSAKKTAAVKRKNGKASGAGTPVREDVSETIQAERDDSLDVEDDDDDEGDESGSRNAGGTSDKPKKTNRKAQNRNAQRESRQRKAEYVKALEGYVALHKVDMSSQLQGVLFAIGLLIDENLKLRSTLGAISTLFQDPTQGSRLPDVGIDVHKLKEAVERNDKSFLLDLGEKLRDRIGMHSREAQATSLVKEAQEKSSEATNRTSSMVNMVEVQNGSNEGKSGSEDGPIFGKLTARAEAELLEKLRISGESLESGGLGLLTAPHSPLKAGNSNSHTSNSDASAQQVPTQFDELFRVIDHTTKMNKVATTEGTYTEHSAKPSLGHTAPQGSSTGTPVDFSEYLHANLLNHSSHDDLANMDFNQFLFPSGPSPPGFQMPDFTNLGMRMPSYDPPTSSYPTNSFIPNVNNFLQPPLHQTAPSPAFGTAPSASSTFLKDSPNDGFTHSTGLSNFASMSSVSPAGGASTSQIASLKETSRTLHKQAKQLIEFHLRAKQEDDTHELPAALEPTAAQGIMPHDARLDGILWPAMRDRLIFSSGKIDLQGVLASLESGEAVVVHATGDLMDPAAWEVSEAFVHAYPGLLDGEILKVCNKWRSARGETQIAL